MADEPTRAALARRLMGDRRFGVLCTLSKRMPGYPFGSIAPFITDTQGRAIFLISAMAVHTKNLQENSHASLLIFDKDAEQDPLGAARMNLIGDVQPVPEEELPEIRAAYLEQHPESEEWIEFGDFAFYRLSVEDVYYIGGFGAMGWVSKRDYIAV